MKKILIYLTGENGCTLHRLVLPYAYINKELFEVQFGLDKDKLRDTEEIKKYDAIVFHSMLPNGLIDEIKKNCPNTKIICDIDDSWELSSSHIMYQHYQTYNVTDEIKKHIKMSDYITTTTEILSDKIKPFNPNVHIFPNALIADGEFKPLDIQSSKLRFGIIGGCTHITDMQLLDGMVNQLPADVLDKVQFVLGGFDKGLIQIPTSDGKIETRLMPWEDNLWTKMEKILTNDYKTVSKEHKEFLTQYIEGMNYTTDEAYRRIWTKDIWNYATIYDDIDVLLVPLVDNGFNKNKSELKMIEASIKNKACIVSDVYPYKICAINAIEKGGNINTEGNCIMVNNQKGSRGWAKAITRLVKDKELRDMIRINLHKLTEEGAKYDIRKVSKDRSKFLEEIL